PGGAPPPVARPGGGAPPPAGRLGPPRMRHRDAVAGCEGRPHEPAPIDRHGVRGMLVPGGCTAGSAGRSRSLAHAGHGRAAAGSRPRVRPRPWAGCDAVGSRGLLPEAIASARQLTRGELFLVWSATEAGSKYLARYS